MILDVIFNNLASGWNDVLSEIRRTPKKKIPSPILLEALFGTALDLYEKYPLSHPEIAADKIFGPLSAIYTWENKSLTEEEAEKIVREGSDVIIPEGKTKEEEEQEKREEEELIKRRQVQRKRLLSNILSQRKSTLLLLAGLAGLILAVFARDQNSGPYAAIAHKLWITRSWLAKWVLGNW